VFRVNVRTFRPALHHGVISMALMKTSNPALGQNTFSDFARNQTGGNLIDAAQRMTLSGTVNKTGILLLCAVATAAWTWNSFMQTHDISRLPAPRS
jgi:uncharacterized YccA/Bax inhibitor family protein